MSRGARDYRIKHEREIVAELMDLGRQFLGRRQVMKGVAELIHDALDSFAARDAELAVRVTVRDKNVDDFYNSIFRTLLTFMMENPNNIGQSTHLLFIAKNIERVGDHATNIAEMVYYAATGQHLADRPRGADSLKG